MNIRSEPFGVTKAGEPVTRWTLQNRSGMSVGILSYACAVQNIIVPDRNGNPVDVALGYDNLAGYEAGSCYFGAFVGRYANRIKGACFELNGKSFALEKNDGENHLHGVYCRQVFDGLTDGDSLTFRRVSPDGEEGYPDAVRETDGTYEFATVVGDRSGIVLKAFATQPAVQFYSGNYVDKDTAPCGKNGLRYPRYGGFCLETQHYPCSPNYPQFPSTLLRPGETYLQKTVYRFE